MGRASPSRDGRPALRHAFLPTFLRDQRGAVAIYVGVLVTVLVGMLVIVFDVGRLAVVRSQAQNTADAAAIAAAVHLDGQAGARARAEAVARGAADQRSGIQTVSGSPNIQIDTVNFYSDEDRSPATGDFDAGYVEVTVVPRPVELMFEPVVAAFAGATSQGFTEIGASAMAVNAPGVCNPPRILVCNTDEVGLADLTSAAAAGRQILLRQAGNAPAPGEYAMLCPPPLLSCGAPIIEDFMASLGSDECTTDVITTKTGVNFRKVVDGTNHRFEDGSLPYPMAPNIVEYPRDSAFELDVLGNGDWDRSGYWEENHDGASLPVDLAGATRLQVYLYELGVDFARSNSDGRTLFPVPDTVPTDFTVVYPTAFEVPADGVPPGIPTDDPRRRILPAAVVQCQALNVRGNFDIETRYIRIVDLFITEPVGPPPATQSPIVGEFVRLRTTANSDSLIGNVRLVD